MSENEIAANQPDIVCFHLFNDFSGSPIILRTVLKGLLQKGYHITLRTSRGGILDSLHNEHLKMSYYAYHFSLRPLVTMARYAWVQCHSFFYAFRYIGKSDCVLYINTLLPVGPAVAGWLMGKRVIYHYHENAWIKGRVYKTLSWIMQRIASVIICVSDYQRRSLQDNRKVIVVPNAVSDKFINSATVDAEHAYCHKTVLMACSCKRYKGVEAFFQIAERLPQFQFLLVLNESQEKVDEFLNELGVKSLPNLGIEPSTGDMASVYARASLLLNLSDRTQVIETFGMTVVEAMCFGLPCIVPVEGGISELVQEGETGYHVDSHDSELLAQRISSLLTDHDLYCQMSKKAASACLKYKESEMVNAIHHILTNTHINKHTHK